MSPLISMIVAMDKNRLVGANNQLPWKLSADLKRFKAITMSKPVIMGRKTYESIGKPLPGRQNIIISRNPDYQVEGCESATSIDAAIQLAGEVAEIMIIGGMTVYEQALSLTNRLYLTLINAEFQGDAWFPVYNKQEWEQRDLIHVNDDNSVDFTYQFVTLQRRI